MGTTVRERALRFHPLPRPSRKMRVARDLGISVALADKLLYGEHALNLRYAAVIESDVRARDHEAVAQWVAPADAALMGDDVPHFMDALCDYDRADVAEDAEQIALNRKCMDAMTDAELEAYGRAVARELYAGTRFLARLRQVQRDRKEAAR